MRRRERRYVKVMMLAAGSPKNRYKETQPEPCRNCVA